jgi:hypothetical protein
VLPLESQEAFMLAKPNRVYDSDDLKMLSQVLEEALKATIKCNDSPVSDTQIRETSLRLGRVIMDHFATGETDPEVLKAIALNTPPAALRP